MIDDTTLFEDDLIDSSDFNYSGDMYFTYGFGQFRLTNTDIEVICKLNDIQSSSFNATGNFESNAISLADSSSINKGCRNYISG